MNQIDHLLVFVSIILGLAVGKTLTGFAYLIDERRRVQWDIVYVLWGFGLLLGCIMEWYGLWESSRLNSNLGIYEFILIIVRPIALFLACAVLFPDPDSWHSKNIILWEHFITVKTMLLTSVMIASASSLVEQLILPANRAYLLEGVDPGERAFYIVGAIVFYLVPFVVAGTALLVRRRRYQIVTVVLIISFYLMLFS